MIGTARSMRADAVVVPALPSRKPEAMAPMIVTGNLHGRRHAIDMKEHEDAHLTGMTRSLDRRLLALNLKPVASISKAPALKVA
jgi:hypothetical protein